MSATTTTTAVLTMATATLRTDHHDAQSCCPGCGIGLPPNTDANILAEASKAQARISELEAQVRLLNQKATAAVDRWADYEDEIARLRSQQPPPPQQQQQSKSLAPSPEPASPARTSFLQTGTNRLSQLLSARKSTPNLHEANQPSPLSPSGRPHMPRSATDAEELIAALSREKSLRKEAEGKLNATSREVEELSVSLFEQANEMVATERRARAALEERVGELERRDKEKARRLERLEKAMVRIENMRALLKETEV